MKKIIYMLIYAMLTLLLLRYAYKWIIEATQYAYNYTYAMMAKSDDDNKSIKEVEITIPEGATTKEIAVLLKSHDLIRNEDLFRLQSFVNSNDSKYRPGTFVLSTSMDDDDIMDVLTLEETEVVNTDIKVTIPEGLTLKSIAAKLEKEGVVSADKFINAANSGDFDYPFVSSIPPRDNRLEGYLFPDTYFFRENSTPDEVISKLLKRFDDIYDAELRSKAAVMGYTMDEVIIMASIIESEIRVPEERELASAVIYNRLEQEMKLEMCSTVMYALGVKRDKLLLTDLQVDSPYNTYVIRGLPEGPICNPGEAAIRAALNPTNDNYLYFVLKDEETGAHHFTNDFDDFLNAKAEYNQQF